MANKKRQPNNGKKSIWNPKHLYEVLNPKNANRIWWHLIHYPTVLTLDQIPWQKWSIGENAKQRILNEFVMHGTKIVEVFESSRGDTTKLLIELFDGHRIETVIMKHHKRTTVCLSSQVGCRMGCRFCATGTMGIIGDLDACEIIEQLVYANRISTVRNVVFMGMGEPLNNYDNVKIAAEFMVDTKRFSLSPKHVTVSTVGVIKNMYRLSDEIPHINLALSLHAPNQTLRKQIIPTAGASPIHELILAVKYHIDKNMASGYNGSDSSGTSGSGGSVNGKHVLRYSNIEDDGDDDAIDNRITDKTNTLKTHVTDTTTTTTTTTATPDDDDDDDDIDAQEIASFVINPNTASELLPSTAINISDMATTGKATIPITGDDSTNNTIINSSSSGSSSNGNNDTTNNNTSTNTTANAIWKKTRILKYNVMIEYILIADLNDTSTLAHELGVLLQPLQEYILLNLIPYNPTEVKEDFKAPSIEAVENFKNILFSSPYCIHTRIRQEMGQDIAGACGQLVLNKTGIKKKKNDDDDDDDDDGGGRNSHRSLEIEDILNNNHINNKSNNHNNNKNNNTINNNNNTTKSTRIGSNNTNSNSNSNNNNTNNTTNNDTNTSNNNDADNSSKGMSWIMAAGSKANQYLNDRPMVTKVLATAAIAVPFFILASYAIARRHSRS